MVLAVHPPCIPTGGLDLVPTVAEEMPEHGIALLDVRDRNVPAAM